jgi:hypothetical protein
MWQSCGRVPALPTQWKTSKVKGIVPVLGSYRLAKGKSKVDGGRQLERWTTHGQPPASFQGLDGHSVGVARGTKRTVYPRRPEFRLMVSRTRAAVVAAAMYVVNGTHRHVIRVLGRRLSNVSVQDFCERNAHVQDWCKAGIVSSVSVRLLQDRWAYWW